MRFRTAMMVPLLFGPWAAWGQEANSWKQQEGKRQPIPDPYYQDRVPPGISVNHRGLMSMRSPGMLPTTSTPDSTVFSGGVTNKVLMTHAGTTDFASGIFLTQGLMGGPTSPTSIFSIPFLADVSSTYVDVTFLCNLVIWPGAGVTPGSTGLGATIDCRVEQDLDNNGTYETSIHCSGISDSLKPWMVFTTVADYFGSTYMAQFRGYAPISALNNILAPAATRVVVELTGSEWSPITHTASGEIRVFNRTLKILY
ncbi:MAG: hypothetical protein IPP78_00135 [Holophagaceae bacterium]|nr:hypothetical protein [Holophagaceae bacterium]